MCEESRRVKSKACERETLKAAAHPDSRSETRPESCHMRVHTHLAALRATAVSSSTERKQPSTLVRASESFSAQPTRSLLQKLLGCQSDRPAFSSLAAPSFPSRPSCPKRPKRSYTSFHALTCLSQNLEEKPKERGKEKKGRVQKREDFGWDVVQSLSSPLTSSSKSSSSSSA